MTIEHDVDGYLLKCSLELIEDGVPPEQIQALCACKTGMGTCDVSDDDNNNPQNGD